MFNDLRNGINTRLYSKKEYNNSKQDFLNNRSIESINFIKNDNKSQYKDFNLFNDKINDKYSDIENDYKKFSNSFVKKKTNFDSSVTDSTPIRKFNTIFSNTNKSNNIQTVNIRSLKKSQNKKQPVNTEVILNKSQNKTQPVHTKSILKNTDNKSYLLEKKINTQYKDIIFLKKDIINLKKNRLEMDKINRVKQKEINDLISEQEKINKQKQKQIDILIAEQEKNYKIIEYMKKNYSNRNNDMITNLLKNKLKMMFPNISDILIDKYIYKYKLSDINYSYKILNSIIHDVKKELEILTKNKIKVREYTISINSINRDIEKWPSASEFQIHFSTNSEKNDHIKQDLHNISQIQLVSAIIPKKDSAGNLLENYPYLNLEIPELTNYLNSSFSQLTFDIDVGNFKKLVPRYDNEYTIKLEPPISINHLTFTFKTPDKKLYNLSNDNKTINKNMVDEDIDDQNHKENPNNEISLIFNVTQVIRDLNENMNI